MILLDNIIEILALANEDIGTVNTIVLPNRGRVTATLVDRDFLREPLGRNRFAQENQGRRWIRGGVKKKSTVWPALSTAR